MSVSINSIAYSKGNYIKTNVELNILRGFPDFNILGLSPKQSNQIQHKFKSVLQSSGFQYKPQKIVANIYPSILSKDLTTTEAPLFLSYLIHTNQIKYQPTPQHLFIGEFTLSGTAKSGVVTTDLLIKAKELGFQTVFIPKEDLNKFIDYTGLNIVGYSSFKDLVYKLHNFSYSALKPSAHVGLYNQLHFDDIVNNYFAKKVLTITIGGFMNTLIIGEPGVGKSMLVKTLPTIFPEASRFYRRQFRTGSDNHPSFILDSTVTKSVLSGQQSKAGLIQQANLGFIAINEINQVSKNVHNFLKSTIEEKEFNLNGQSIKSVFSFIGTMNPCKCGFSNSSEFKCSCNTYSKQTFIKKIGVPFFDRFDLFLDFNSHSQPKVKMIESSSETETATSQVKKLHQYQEKNNLFITLMTYKKLQNFLNEKSSLLFNFSTSKLNLSLRRQVKLLRVALCISILKNKEFISSEDLYEALTYQKFFYDLLEKKDSRELG